MFRMICSLLLILLLASGSDAAEIDASAYKSFSACIASPATAGKTILVSAPMPIDSIMIPADRHLRFVAKGMLVAQAGATPIVRTSWEAGRVQIFKGEGTGRFIFQPASGKQLKLYWEWFGARGDGKTDNATALQFMWSCLDASDHNTTWLFDLVPKGHYRYSFNRFLRLKNFVLEGNGASLQNIARDSYDYPRYPLVVGGKGRDFFQDSYRGPEKYGYLIKSAAPGTTTVRLKQAGDASHFFVGGAVVVYSYDRQFGGYPPNPKFYDYARVKAINGGVITLDTPVSHSHSDNYPEIPSIPSSRGKARIALIDRRDDRGAVVNEMAHRITMRNFTLLDNPNFNSIAQYLLAESIEEFTIEGANINMFEPTESIDVVARNCTFRGHTDYDKFMVRGLFENCDIQQGLRGVGPKNLTLRNNRIGGTVRTCADVVTVIGNTFTAQTAPGDRQHAFVVANNRQAVINNNRFVGKNNSTDESVGSYGGDTKKIRIAGPVSIANNYTITIPMNDLGCQQFLAAIEPGALVYAGERINSRYTTRNNFGAVQAIRDSGDNGRTAQIDIRFDRTVKANDYVVAVLPVVVDVENNSYEGAKHVFSMGPAVATLEDYLNNGVYTYRFDRDISTVTFDVFHRINKIVVEVVKPYTGTQKNAFLFLADVAPDFHSILDRIDLKIAGRREITLSGTAGSAVTDKITALPAGNFPNYFSFWNTNSVGGKYYQFTDNGNQMAVVNVKIVTDKAAFNSPMK